MKHIDPEIYLSILKKLKETEETRTLFTNKFIYPIEQALTNLGIIHTITTREKSIFSIWEKMKNNDYIAFSCDCNGGPTAKLWTDVTVDRLPEEDRDAVVLTAPWCKTCGPGFCAAIMAGEAR